MLKDMKDDSCSLFGGEEFTVDNSSRAGQNILTPSKKDDLEYDETMSNPSSHSQVSKKKAQYMQ